MISKKNLFEWGKLVSKYTKECTLKECLFPEKEKCSETVIKGHSIQKSRILEDIAHNGKVMSFSSRLSYDTSDFAKIGIRKASTFFGFCNKHDTSIFSDIENKFYEERLEQDFLYAYRACAKQYMEQRFALCIHGKILTDVKKTPRNLQFIPTLLNEIEFDKYLINILTTALNRFHIELQKDSSERNYRIIETNIKKLPYRTLLAINSLINLDLKTPYEKIIYSGFQHKIIKPLFLNVFPQNSKTYILLSYFSGEQNEYERIFSLMDSFNNIDLEMFYSRVILLQCLNFFISPVKWILLSKRVRKDIVSNLINNMIISLKPDIRNYFKSSNFDLKPTINLFQLLKEL